MLEIAHACVTEEINGPGRRFTVWVQGCPLDCAGCFNPALRPTGRGREVAPEALARQALAERPWEGVTLSGGEPFSQAPGLGEFLDRLRGEAGPVGAIAFSGRTVERLWEGEWQGLLGRLDLLVDGPYRPELASNLPLRGSANQRLVALTPAGIELRERAVAGSSGATVSVVIDGEGGVILTGFPPASVTRTFRAGPGKG